MKLLIVNKFFRNGGFFNVQYTQANLCQKF